MATKDKDDDKDEAEGTKPKSKLPLILMIVGALVLVGGSIGATLMLSGGSHDDEAATEDEETVAEAEDGEDKDGHKARKGKKDKKGDKGDKGDKKKGKEGKHTEAAYLTLDPAFVVNSETQGSLRYLQVGVDLMSRDPVALENAKKHMPSIRHSLVMLLSGQNFESVSTREGKEKLREQALAEVQKILHDNTGENGIEALFFTSFVMQ